MKFSSDNFDMHFEKMKGQIDKQMKWARIGAAVGILWSLFLLLVCVTIFGGALIAFVLYFDHIAAFFQSLC